MRIALPVVPVTRDREKPPHMPRDKLQVLTARVLSADSLAGALAVLRSALRRMEGDWAKYVRMMVRGLSRLAREPTRTKVGYKVFGMKGNTKLPFANFSTLPDHTCPGAGECLNWCYSFTAWRYPTAWSRQVQNTLLLKFRPDIVSYKFKVLPADIVLRLYVDGDFESVERVGFWMELLRSRPDIKGYGYSKSWDELVTWGQTNEWPANYQLNLSSGGRVRNVSPGQVSSLPVVRGPFIALSVKGYYKPKKRGKVGFERYDDPEYHRAVREAAKAEGLTKVFSCPGKCGECAGGKHACGSELFKDVTIVNGVH